MNKRKRRWEKGKRGIKERLKRDKRNSKEG
jgi:hypothetical protein